MNLRVPYSVGNFFHSSWLRCFLKRGSAPIVGWYRYPAQNSNYSFRNFCSRGSKMLRFTCHEVYWHGPMYYRSLCGMSIRIFFRLSPAIRGISVQAAAHHPSQPDTFLSACTTVQGGQKSLYCPAYFPFLCEFYVHSWRNFTACLYPLLVIRGYSQLVTPRLIISFQEAESFLQSQYLFSYYNSRPFMELRRFIPTPKQSARNHIHIRTLLVYTLIPYFLKIHFSFIPPPPCYSHAVQVVPPLQTFATNISYTFLISCVLHVPPISSSKIWLMKHYSVKMRYFTTVLGAEII